MPIREKTGKRSKEDLLYILIRTRKSSCGKPQKVYRPRHNLSKCHSVLGGVWATPIQFPMWGVPPSSPNGGYTPIQSQQGGTPSSPGHGVPPLGLDRVDLLEGKWMGVTPLPHQKQYLPPGRTWDQWNL